MGEYLQRFFWYKPPEIKEDNLSMMVAAAMAKSRIYLKDAQGITESPKISNLEKDRRQRSLGNLRDEY